MNFAEVMLRNIREARSMVLSPDEVLPMVRRATTQAAREASLRGEPVRVSVTTRSTQVHINAQGPGAARVKAAVLRTIVRETPQQLAEKRKAINAVLRKGMG